MLRKLLIVAVIAAGSALLWLLAGWPYVCNIRLKEIEMQTLLIKNGRIPAKPAADENLRALESCGCLRSTGDYHNLVAFNLSFSGRNESARGAVEDALRFSRHPELYMNLATLDLQARDTEAAIVNYARAVEFRRALIRQVPLAVRAEVEKRLSESTSSEKSAR